MICGIVGACQGKHIFGTSATDGIDSLLYAQGKVVINNPKGGKCDCHIYLQVPVTYVIFEGNYSKLQTSRKTMKVETTSNPFSNCLQTIILSKML